MKFSIIIPIYNAEKYLQRCMECVFKQSYTDWELILVDDGSTDNSLFFLKYELPQIARKFSIDNNIQVLSQENAGPSAARNRGLEVAFGEYVAFIDADDWFDEHLLQAYAEAIAEHSWDIVFQGFVREKSDGSVSDLPLTFDTDTNRQSKDEIVCQLYKGHVYGWSWCKVFRREIIEKYSIRFDENLCLWEDELLTTHFLAHAQTITVLPCRHYHYVQYVDSLMNTNNTYLRRLALSEIMNESLKDIANDELWEYVNETYNRSLKFSMLMALMNKPDHKCTVQEKRLLVQKYFTRSQEYPSLKKYNALKNRISYVVAESILFTRWFWFISSIMSRLG